MKLIPSFPVLGMKRERESKNTLRQWAERPNWFVRMGAKRN